MKTDIQKTEAKIDFLLVQIPKGREDEFRAACTKIGVEITGFVKLPVIGG